MVTGGEAANLRACRANLPVDDVVIEQTADAPAGTLARVLAGGATDAPALRVAGVLLRGHMDHAEAEVVILGAEVEQGMAGWARVVLLVVCPGCQREFVLGRQSPTYLKPGLPLSVVWSMADDVGCPTPTLRCPPRLAWRPVGVRVLEEIPE